MTSRRFQDRFAAASKRRRKIISTRWFARLLDGKAITHPKAYIEINADDLRRSIECRAEMVRELDRNHRLDSIVLTADDLIIYRDGNPQSA